MGRGKNNLLKPLKLMSSDCVSFHESPLGVHTKSLCRLLRSPHFLAFRTNLSGSKCLALEDHVEGIPYIFYIYNNILMTCCDIEPGACIVRIESLQQFLQPFLHRAWGLQPVEIFNRFGCFRRQMTICIFFWIILSFQRKSKSSKIDVEKCQALVFVESQVL